MHEDHGKGELRKVLEAVYHLSGQYGIRTWNYTLDDLRQEIKWLESVDHELKDVQIVGENYMDNKIDFWTLV